MKFSPLSLAIALASRVFPHPGGPASKIPGGCVSPSRSNCSGNLKSIQIQISNIPLEGALRKVAYRWEAALSVISESDTNEQKSYYFSTAEGAKKVTPFSLDASSYLCNKVRPSVRRSARS